MDGARRRMSSFMKCCVHRLLLHVVSSVEQPFALLLCLNPVLSSAARTLESWFRVPPGACFVKFCYTLQLVIAQADPPPMES